ncbi:hypothetical protein L7F22_017655 [Adiantum nelumboides]|nr:hypothetical protein [Adiantum nelumboides]
MPEGPAKEYLLYEKKVMELAALAFLQPEEQMKDLGHDFLPLPMMRHEAILWKEKMRPAVPRNEEGGYEVGVVSRAMTDTDIVHSGAMQVITRYLHQECRDSSSSGEAYDVVQFFIINLSLQFIKMLLKMAMNVKLRLPLLAILFFFLRSYSASAVIEKEGDSLNVSSISWTSAADGGFEDAAFDDNDANRGFGSLDSMLQWAIGHSDPATLQGVAQAVKNLTTTELKARRSAIMEAMETLRMPSNTDLMKAAIADLENASSSLEDKQHALQELLELVEPIYNSNDFQKLGGLVVVVNELDTKEQDLRILAAWVLGKASQNNEAVQNQVFAVDQITLCSSMVFFGVGDVQLKFHNGSSFMLKNVRDVSTITRSLISTAFFVWQANATAANKSTEEAVKALYALSAVIRNYPMGQEQFYSLEGASLLEDLMKDRSYDIRLRRKSLFLVADLAEQQKESGGLHTKYEPSKSYLMAVVSLLEVDDLDTQEKALMAIHSLGGLSEIVRNTLKQECNLESAVHKLQLQLEAFSQSDDLLDFVEDLQSFVTLRKGRVLSVYSQEMQLKLCWSNHQGIFRMHGLPNPIVERYRLLGEGSLKVA